MNLTKKILLGLFILITFLLRFWNVASTPQGLYYDEIDAGYQARSILETGRDYRGSWSPFYVSSFLDPRPPIPIYLTVLSTALFSTPELQVRMGSVILGTVNVLLVFILLRFWTKNDWIAFTGLIVTATNPWWIQFSRYNHEANTTIFFPLLGIILFLLGTKIKKFKWIILSIISLALGIYTYRTMSLMTPVILFCLVISHIKYVNKLGLKKNLFLLGLFLLITLSMIIATTFFAKDKPRIAQIAIFVDQSIPVHIQRQREIDSGDLTDFSIGKQTTFASRIFHNKLDSYLEAFVKNYYSAFSTDFLFVHGDKNHRHSIEGQGMIFYTDLIALGFGIYFLFKNRRQPYAVFILLLFFLSPIPSSLTQDGDAHASRLFLYSLPLLFTITFGWYFFIQSVYKIRFGKPLILVIILIHLTLFMFYLHQYHTHFAIDSGRWFGSPYKTAIQKIMQHQSSYSHVILVPYPDPPNLYLLFWGNFAPKEAQNFGTNFNEVQNNGMFLDKFKIAGLPQTGTADMVKALAPDTLYLVTQQEVHEDLRDGKKVPDGINLLEVITYPDKEIAFYIISKKTDTLNQ